MQPIHFTAPAALAAYIAFYGIIDVGEDFHEPYCSPPLGLCGFQITLAGKSNPILNGEPFLVGDHCVTGQVTATVTGEISGRTKVLMVFIQPCGLYQLFGFDMSMLTNTSISLDKFLGDEDYKSLMEKLNAAKNNEGLIHVLNDYFLAQLPVFEVAPKVAHALDYIHEHKGNVSIKDIEANCFITPRSLERHFKMYIGLSPKEYAKIYRFKCLVNFINLNPAVTWNNLCEQNGYYDQSHLTRYFTRYLKTKPGDLVNLDMKFISYLLQEI